MKNGDSFYYILFEKQDGFKDPKVVELKFDDSIPYHKELMFDNSDFAFKFIQNHFVVKSFNNYQSAFEYANQWFYFSNDKLFILEVRKLCDKNYCKFIVCNDCGLAITDDCTVETIKIYNPI